MTPRDQFDHLHNHHNELRRAADQSFREMIALEKHLWMTPHWHRVGDIIQLGYEEPVGIDSTSFEAKVLEMTEDGYLSAVMELDSKHQSTGIRHNVSDFHVAWTHIREPRA